MGFWSGVAQGMSEERDRQLKRELYLGQKESDARSKLFSRKVGLLKDIQERLLGEREDAKSRARLARTFEERLDTADVSPEERRAFLNIVTHDPDLGGSLLKSIQKQEEANPGVRLEGKRLLRFNDLIAETQPEGYSREEWIDEAAGRTYDFMAGTTHYENEFEAVMGAESLEELPMFVTPPASSTDEAFQTGVADPDPTTVRGMDPQANQNYRQSLVDLGTDLFNSDFTEVRSQLEQYETQGVEPPQEIMQRYNQLEPIQRAFDAGETTPILDNYGSQAAQQIYQQDPQFAQSQYNYLLDVQGQHGQEQTGTNY